jgi:hypothetical protein
MRRWSTIIGEVNAKKSGAGRQRAIKTRETTQPSALLKTHNQMARTKQIARKSIGGKSVAMLRPKVACKKP